MNFHYCNLHSHFNSLPVSCTCSLLHDFIVLLLNNRFENVTEIMICKVHAHVYIHTCMNLAIVRERNGFNYQLEAEVGF